MNNLRRFTILGSMLIVVSACAVALADTDAKRSNADDAATTWPLRIEYRIESRVHTGPDAELGITYHVFEGQGFHSWIDRQVTAQGEPLGGCVIRDEYDFLASNDGCDGPYFSDAERLRPGDDRGVNPFIRPYGGLDPEEVVSAEPVDELATRIASEFGIPPDEIRATVTSASTDCRSVGIDCDSMGIATNRRAIHMPTSIELFEEEHFNGRLLYRFEVMAIAFGADMPERLTD